MRLPITWSPINPTALYTESRAWGCFHHTVHVNSVSNSVGVPCYQHLFDHRKNKRFPENIYLCFIDYAKVFDCVDHNKLWKILQEMGIPDHLTCLLRNLYAGQEATVRTGHGTTDWFQIRKGYVKAVYCHPDYLTSTQSTS